MTTLIVPCAGKSSRFKNVRPKYLLTYPDGKLMVEKAIHGLDLKKYSRIIITVVKEHCDRYESDIILKQVFNHYPEINVEICILPQFTKSQSETVIETIHAMDIKDQVIVKDSDNYLEIEDLPKGNFIVGLNLKEFKKEVRNLSAKSFLLINEQNNVIDIIEKEIKSNHLCIGMYGFDNPQEICRAYQELLEKYPTSSEEIYLSHVISYMIGVKKMIFQYKSANTYEDWGTPEEWRSVQIRHSTIFLDLDGVIFKNLGKYGTKNWSNSTTILDDNLKLIKEKYDDGAQIIITTSRGKEFEERVQNIFREYGIEIHAIITSCNHAPRIVVNDFAPSNPFPSSRSINIPRNGTLRDYL